MLDLLEPLRRDGDERGLRAATELLLAQPLGKDELDAIVGPALHDAAFWNTELPAWKQALLARWMQASGLASTPQWLASQTPVAVTVRFRARSAYSSLVLQGDWNEKGEPSDIGGWTPVALKRGAGGDWSAVVRLRRSRPRHIYRAVARTAPWPRGRAVGAVDFEVRGPAEVRVEEIAPPAAAAAKPSGPEPKPVGVAVLGVDGASWHYILPWVYQGRLPNFARLWREGSVATLIASTQDPGAYPSVPNIYCAMTGKLIPKHRTGRGIADGNFDTNLPRAGAPLWKIVSDSGLRAAAVSMWATFPPDSINGAVVTEVYFALQAMSVVDVEELSRNSLLLGLAKDFGVGEGFVARILKMLRFLGLCFKSTHPTALGPRLAPSLSGAGAGGLDGLVSLLDGYTAQAVAALVERERFDMLCAFVTSVDTAKHLFLGEASSSLSTQSDRRDQPAGRLLEAYEKADALIGVMMRRSRHFILFSDHGFGLVPSPSLPLLDMDRFMGLLQKSLGARVEYKMDEWTTGQRERTFWLTEPRDPQVARSVEALFKTAVYLPGGQPVFARVVAEGSGSEGFRFTLEPAAAPETTGLRLGGAEYSTKDFMGALAHQIRHMGNGIIAVIGPGVKPGRRAEAAHITDIAPTALYLADLPSAEDMDGRVLEDIFEASYRDAHPARAVKSYGSGGSGLLRLLKALRWDPWRQ